MPKVVVMEYEPESRRFMVLKEVGLTAVPRTGEKIVLNHHDIGYIYQVHDVHYAEQGIDVNVVALGELSEYYKAKSDYPDAPNAKTARWVL